MLLSFNRRPYGSAERGGKRMKKFGILAVIMAVLLTGCGGGSGDKKEASKDGLDACKISVGFVTDMGGIDDRSFNQGSYEGIQRFAKDQKLGDQCIKYLESKTEADYVTNLSTLSDEGFDLVVAAGYLFVDAMNQVSDQYPDTKYLVIDAAVEKDNVQSALFAANETSYLAGVAAAMKAKELGSNDIGFIGGAEGEVIGEFQAGFEQGALAVNPDAKIYVDYAGSFDDAGTAQTLAAKQYDAGVKVIFHAAGNAGNGVIKEAQTRTQNDEEVYVVGVDKDQYETGLIEGTDKSVILTSALKRVDEATYQAAQSLLDGNFKAGIINYTFKEEGIGYPEENPNLDESITTALDKAIEDIKAGTITVEHTPTIKNGSSN